MAKPKSSKSSIVRMHAIQLEEAKRDLMAHVNRYVTEQRSKGNKTVITPQIQNLLRETKYTARTLNRIKSYINSPSKLEDYVVVADKSGNIISGEVGLQRWQTYINSSLYNPESDLTSISSRIITNFEDSLTKLFVDGTALTEFTEVLNNAFVRITSNVKGNIDYAANFGEKSAERMAKNARYEEHTIKYFMTKNEDITRDISMAVQTAINMYGEDEVARRIEAHPELIDELAVATASGYRAKATSAARGIIDILLGDDAIPADYAAANEAMLSNSIYEEEYE